MSLVDCKTPEDLYQAIKQALNTTEHKSGTSAEKEPENFEKMYQDARTCIVSFRKIYKELPALPPATTNHITGLQNIMEWCIEAVEIIDKIVIKLDSKLINKAIVLFKKLKELPQKFPAINNDLWNKSKNRAERIRDKLRDKKHYSTNSFFLKLTKLTNAWQIINELSPSQPSYIPYNQISISPLSHQIDAAFKERRFYGAVEKIYRLEDSKYVEGLSNLDSEIQYIMKEINQQLYKLPYGPLLDAYDKLKGISLENLLSKINRAYEINSIIDSMLFGENSFLNPEPKESMVDKIIVELESTSQKITPKPDIIVENENVNTSKEEGAVISKENWEAIEGEFGVNKKDFGKKIKFVSDSFNRKIIFRDVEHAYILASSGFSKPAVILAGGVIEELLRLYLKHKSIPPVSDNFDGYIKTCDQEGLLKSGISRLSDSVRHFRNLVHLAKEETQKHTISKSNAKGAVASIFTIANDF